MKIIPVASTGFAAKEILDDMESHLEVPHYLEVYKEKLKDEKLCVEKIAQLIIEILNNNNPA